MLSGDDGIITQAGKAKEETDESAAEERVKLEVAGSFDKEGYYSPDMAKNNLEKNAGAVVIKNPDDSLDVKYEEYDFKVSSNGEVSKANYFKLSQFSSSGKQGEHTLGIDSEGNLWAWGRNKNGELGNGTTTNSNKPIQILQGTKFKDVASGQWFSLAIDENGTLWTWGYNTFGQLGNGTRNNSSIPTRIKEDTKFEKISAGESHSLAIDENGTLWTWGGNSFGQLGNGTTETSLIPIKIMEDTKFEKISAGGSHSLAIDENGTLWTWGYNSSGQLGNGTTETSLIPIKIMEEIKFKDASLGYCSSIALDENGIIWVFGYNGSGEFGNGTITKTTIPIQTLQDVKIQKIVGGSVSGGRSYNVLIDVDGNVWTCGDNSFGQLGYETETPYSSKIFKKIEL